MRFCTSFVKTSGALITPGQSDMRNVTNEVKNLVYPAKVLSYMNYYVFEKFTPTRHTLIDRNEAIREPLRDSIYDSNP